VTSEHGLSHRRRLSERHWHGRDPAWKDVNGFRGKDDVEKPAYLR
jgi:hypothetical protein